MIQARDLALSFGNRIIFDNISFTLQGDERIGLVGRNGSGKTTLLKALVDSTVLDSGTIAVQKNKKIGYMPQEVVLDSTLSILAETCTVFSQIYSIEQTIIDLERRLEQAWDPALFDKYSKLHDQLEELEPLRKQAEAKKMLMGLGFQEAQFDKPVNELSGGWKMRVVLAKLLLQQADFYLFDEPTNHLDIVAKEWFLHFLKRASFGFILICHEKYFLDELCDSIMELEHGKLAWYNGNYDYYMIEKETRSERLMAAYTQQQKEIKHKEDMIERMRAGQKARMAQSMEKALNKLDRITIPPAPPEVKVSFPPIQPSGKEVLKVTKLSYSFGDKLIFKDISFDIKRGQKAALVAPNGAGKTTLFNLIAGILPLQLGTITFGHNVTRAFFNQDQNQVLKRDLSIIENVKLLCPQISEPNIRNVLGSFLLSGEDVYKKVGVLSGGEKNRVGMVITLLQKANLLLLDEPTNHLDIASKEILLRALQQFEGTIIFVSHDRDFINGLATDIFELTSTGICQYAGNFDDYLYQKNAASKNKK